MKTYAYVRAETCRYIDAVPPGSYVGRNLEAVPTHGDWNPWRHGKRETLRLIASGATPYTRKCAAVVADLLGWR